MLFYASWTVFVQFLCYNLPRRHKKCTIRQDILFFEIPPDTFLVIKVFLAKVFF